MQSSIRSGRPEARIVLQPLAAPSVLGYFALGSALIVWGSWFAGGWGTEKDPSSFFPFLLLFGGVGQFGAALWSYRARAAVGAALHGSWAAFWMGLGIVYLLVTTKTITVPPRDAHWGSLGQWMIYMSVISFTTAFADLARDRLGSVAQAVLGTAAACAAVALLRGSSGWEEVAGWLFVAAAAVAIFAGTAQMMGAIYGRDLVPRRGGKADPVAYEHGDPGVKVGQ